MIVVPSGATLGTANNVPFRLWIFIELNGGVPELGVAICSSTSQIFPCAAWEMTRITTVTITGLAATSGVLYSTAGVSNDSVRIIGYAEYSSGLPTVGAWSANPTTLQLAAPGMKRPGDVVQTITTSSTTAATTASATFAALSATFTQAITPTSSVNLVRYSMSGSYLISATQTAGIQLARTSTLIGVPIVIAGVIASGQSFNSIALDQPQTTSSTAYGFQGKIAGGATLSVPPANSGIYIMLEEIQGALGDPANDNVNPGVLSATG